MAYIINHLALDLEKKLSVYDRKYNYILPCNYCGDLYQELVLLVIDFSNEKDINEELVSFNDKYEQEVKIENNSIYTPKLECMGMLSTEILKFFYKQDKSNAFELWLNIIEKKLANYGYSFDLRLEYNERKYFLVEATNYIIKQKQHIVDFKKLFLNISEEKKQRLRYINLDDIPKKFTNIFDNYCWFIKYEHTYYEYLRIIDSYTIDSLLHYIIREEERDLDNYQNNERNYKQLNRILDNCSNDYLIMGEILTSKDIKLNSYFLKNPKYALYGLLNITQLENSPSHLISGIVNYSKQWKETILFQAVDIFFMHYENLQNFEKVEEDLFNLLNFIVSKSIGNNNQDNFSILRNYTLKKLSSFEIVCLAKGIKKSFLDEILVSLVNRQVNQLKRKNFLDVADYYLLVWYLENIDEKIKVKDVDYSFLITSITEVIIQNFEKIVFSVKNGDGVYFRLDELKEINYTLLFKLSDIKIQKQWYELINIQDIKFLINNENHYDILKLIELVFTVFLDIYKKYPIIEFSKILNQLAIDFGLHDEIGIFVHWSNNSLFNEFIDILDYFEDREYKIFLNEFYKFHDIKELLFLYDSTIREGRKTKLLELILEEAKSLKKLKNFSDIEYAMIFASSNSLHDISHQLFSIYEEFVKSRNYDMHLAEYKKISCKKKMLDIYYAQDISINEKFIQLNDVKIPFTDKNQGSFSKELDCERHDSFVRSAIYYDTEPKKTYELSKILCEEEVNSVYLSNMLKAYFKWHENSKNKIEKYKFILDEYFEFYKEISLHNRSAYEYDLLFYGYLETNNVKEFDELWKVMPLKYRNDIYIMSQRYEYLMKNNEFIKAEEYLQKVLQAHDNSKKVKEEIIQLKSDFKEHTKSFFTRGLEKGVFEQIKEIPLILTEGKTDKKILEIAWEKLYASELPFEIEVSGVEIEEENKQGSADLVQRSLELDNHKNRTVIGIFDNDGEGNKRFYGLKKDVFGKCDISKPIRKHLTKNIYGVLLPVPNFRDFFVTKDDMEQRYFVIEHYFSNEVLKRNNMMGSSILGTEVFKVNNGKDRFSKSLKTLESKEFEKFKILFQLLEKIILESE